MMITIMFISGLIKHADPVRYYFYLRSTRTTVMDPNGPLCLAHKSKARHTHKKKGVEESQQQKNLCVYV